MASVTYDKNGQIITYAYPLFQDSTDNTVNTKTTFTKKVTFKKGSDHTKESGETHKLDSSHDISTIKLNAGNVNVGTINNNNDNVGALQIEFNDSYHRGVYVRSMGTNTSDEASLHISREQADGINYAFAVKNEADTSVFDIHYGGEIVQRLPEGCIKARRLDVGDYDASSNAHLRVSRHYSDDFPLL